AGVLTAALAFFYGQEHTDHLTRLQTEERYSLQLQEQIIGQRFNAVITDLLFLARQNELHDLLAADTPRNRQRLASEYRHFAHEKPAYDQIRYLDQSGMEAVRINAGPHGPVIVPDQALQSKKDRYYFKDAVALRRGEIFISPLDLNVEQGKVEVPFKPMIRFATPVFDQTGHKRGIVILNYLAGHLLQAIRDTAGATPGEIMLCNSDGYWLLAPTPDNEWGFMFPDRRERSFAVTYPTIWQTMQEAPSGQIAAVDGFFHYTTITPLSARSPFIKYTRSSSGSPDATGSSAKTLTPQEYYWKLVSHVPQRVLDERFQRQHANLFMLAVILYVLAALPAWFLAKAVTNHQLYQQRLYHMAHFDALTGLPNRTLFHDRLRQAVRTAHRYQRRLSLIYVDLDDFKQVNDQLGHGAGDTLLRGVASRLLDCVRRSDTVGRMGGDEFTVLLSETENREQVAIVAKKIMDALAIPFDLKGAERRIHASLGIAIYPEDGDEPGTLLKNADSAMYQAKQRCKNCYRFYRDAS
ncbi:MAG TPA: diguanylate cyclase, partial [Desulfurivibrionaceae bacterium]|nr:diguanylate cyclase [Desulfurivibrionaceae bacterium]